MTKVRLKKKNALMLLIILISLIGIGYSFFNIVVYLIDAKKTDKQLEEIQYNYTIEEVQNSNATIIEQKEEIPEANPYWDYIKMSLINVDIKELKKINKDVKGWLQVNGTNINYPVVQSKDNEYYLRHSLDKSYNRGGWVFFDYRNDTKNFDNKNTIIYAHGMQNKTMFGTLINITSSKWIKNTDNYIIKLSTEAENTLWQVFSVYCIPVTSDYLKTDFANDQEYETFLNTIKDRSEYDFDTTISTNDRIITLSTCYKKVNRVVLHAKLIKSEKR